MRFIARTPPRSDSVRGFISRRSGIDLPLNFVSERNLGRYALGLEALIPTIAVDVAVRLAAVRQANLVVGFQSALLIFVLVGFGLPMLVFPVFGGFGFPRWRRWRSIFVLPGFGLPSGRLPVRFLISVLAGSVAFGCPTWRRLVF